MSKEKIIRAWKDPKYRESLTPEEKAQLPEHPAGPPGALDDSELEDVSGGSGGYVCTLTTECGCPWGGNS